MKLKYLINFLILTLASCTIHREVVNPNINPSNSGALSSVIIFTPDTQQLQGNIPTNSICTNANTVILNDPSLKITNGSTGVFIPIRYAGNTPITMVYVQIQGAGSYFKIPLTTSMSSGDINIPISIPSNVSDGKFILKIILVGANGCVAGTSILTIPIEVGQPLACNSGNIEGYAGITQNVHLLEGKSGKVLITYNNRVAPDRIDVYLDGKWIAGTGTSIVPPPPISTCNGALPGFTGGEGSFLFNVGTNNKQVQVYVSGCTGRYTENGNDISGTAWSYKFSCPQ